VQGALILLSQIVLLFFDYDFLTFDIVQAAFPVKKIGYTQPNQNDNRFSKTEINIFPSDIALKTRSKKRKLKSIHSLT